MKWIRVEVRRLFIVFWGHRREPCRIVATRCKLVPPLPLVAASKATRHDEAAGLECWA